ncbi:zinc finger HIT domain-containing protein 3 [Trichonephila inaurata madagascariensis]|uniref:Zinc finger HIT domain-containing protein 3 n=1 Tax=Trichonephila inaurata madagascariensis TaxID=2747483 RepID=A0A8X7CPH3_9ARAC|nr:zinc finger HIT domain-containing protein 3 [Trichonephila inaurata madagascariensis]
MAPDDKSDLDVKVVRIFKCGICNENESKYKCPVCLVRYCSVACYKTHKAGDSCKKPEPVVEVKPAAVVYEYETEDTVNPEKLQTLGYDFDVRRDLENPHLRQLLTELNSSTNPDQFIKENMNEPIFSDFVLHCLSVINEEKDE